MLPKIAIKQVLDRGSALGVGPEDDKGGGLLKQEAIRPGTSCQSLRGDTKVELLTRLHKQSSHSL